MKDADRALYGSPLLLALWDEPQYRSAELTAKLTKNTKTVRAMG